MEIIAVLNNASYHTTDGYDVKVPETNSKVGNNNTALLKTNKVGSIKVTRQGTTRNLSLIHI